MLMPLSATDIVAPSGNAKTGRSPSKAFAVKWSAGRQRASLSGTAGIPVFSSSRTKLRSPITLDGPTVRNVTGSPPTELTGYCHNSTIFPAECNRRSRVYGCGAQRRVPAGTPWTERSSSLRVPLSRHPIDPHRSTARRMRRGQGQSTHELASSPPPKSTPCWPIRLRAEGKQKEQQ